MIENKKILILGATSFAGSYLVKHALKAGMDVIGVSRSAEYDDVFLPYADLNNRGDYKFLQIDINHNMENLKTLIKNEKPYFIVDFAGQGMVAPSWDWPEQWYNTNLVAKSRLINILNNCDFLECYVKVSTPEVYGSTNGLIDETASYNPSTPYSVSHAAIDMHLDTYFKQYGFPLIKTRHANFYGAHQQLYRVAPKIFLCALNKKIFKLQGGGESTRAFIHGDDVANGILLSISKGEIGGTYHFSTDEFVTIRQLVETALTIAGTSFTDLVEISEDRIGKDAAYLMSAELAKSELGWRPLVNLNNGLRNVHEWVIKNSKILSSLPFDYIHKK